MSSWPSPQKTEQANSNLPWRFYSLALVDGDCPGDEFEFAGCNFDFPGLGVGGGGKDKQRQWRKQSYASRNHFHCGSLLVISQHGRV
jgi:hypothetical protein